MEFKLNIPHSGIGLRRLPGVCNGKIAVAGFVSPVRQASKDAGTNPVALGRILAFLWIEASTSLILTA